MSQTTGNDYRRTAKNMFKWSGKDHSVRDFISEYKEDFPKIVRVTQGYTSCDNDSHEVPEDAVYIVSLVETQERVLARTEQSQFVTIPRSCSVCFQLVNSVERVNKPRRLCDIVTPKTLADDSGMIIQIADNDADLVQSQGIAENNILGRLYVLDIYHEKYLIGRRFNNQGRLHSDLTAIPAYLPLTLDVAVNMAGGSLEEFQKFLQRYKQSESSQKQQCANLTEEIVMFPEPPTDDYEFVEPSFYLPKLSNTNQEYYDKMAPPVNMDRRNVVSQPMPETKSLATNRLTVPASNFDTTHTTKTTPVSKVGPFHVRRPLPPIPPDMKNERFEKTEVASPDGDDKDLYEEYDDEMSKRMKTSKARANKSLSPSNTSSDSRISSNPPNLPKKFLASIASEISNKSLTLTSSGSLTDLRHSAYSDYAMMGHAKASKQRSLDTDSVLSDKGSACAPKDDRPPIPKKPLSMTQFLEISSPTASDFPDTFSRTLPSRSKLMRGGKVITSRKNSKENSKDDHAHLCTDSLDDYILPHSESSDTNESLYDEIKSPFIPVSLDDCEYKDSVSNSNRIPDNRPSFFRSDHTLRTTTQTFSDSDNRESNDDSDDIADNYYEPIGLLTPHRSPKVSESSVADSGVASSTPTEESAPTFDTVATAKKQASLEYCNEDQEDSCCYDIVSESLSTILSHPGKKAPRSASWKSVDDVPVDISSLAVDEVCVCLKILNLHQYIRTFREQQIDGCLLGCLDKDLLMSDFQFRKFDAIKLAKFAREGWRPKLVKDNTSNA